MRIHTFDGCGVDLIALKGVCVCELIALKSLGAELIALRCVCVN